MEYSPRYERLRTLLREIREEAGLSQRALAGKLGKPQSFVSKLEIGERQIDVIEAIDICKACHISVIAFVKRLENDAPGEPNRNRAKRRNSNRRAAKSR